MRQTVGLALYLVWICGMAAVAFAGGSTGRGVVWTLCAVAGAVGLVITVRRRARDGL